MQTLRINVRIDTAENTLIRFFRLHFKKIIMSRFARVTEEVILRRKELAVAHHKTGKIGRSALETLFLYIVILLHSWETGALEKKKFPKLCEIYELDVDNSYRRLKTMRDRGWIEVTKEYIRPLLIHRSKAVTVTDDSAKKAVTVTDDSDEKTVTVTDNYCNSYSNSDEKTVTVTVENSETSIPVVDYDDSKILLNLNKADSTTSTGSKNLSQFQIEECLRWMEWRVENGEKFDLPDRHRIAKWAHRTGEADAFIYAGLYPEGLDKDGRVVPKRLSEEKLDYYVKNLRTMSGAEFDPEEWRKDFLPEDWARLMERLNG